jgi:hypothetical protein
MILCMPTVGQKVRVLDGQTWDFKLYQEHRNHSLYEYVGKPLLPEHRRSFYDDYVGGQKAWDAYRGAKTDQPPLKHIDVSLPGGSVLTIDRIYLRKGAGEFDSITFILNGAKLEGKKGANARVRFWAKLEDVNAGKLELL